METLALILLNGMVATSVALGLYTLSLVATGYRESKRAV